MRWVPGVQTPTGSPSVLYGCAPPPQREQSSVPKSCHDPCYNHTHCPSSAALLAPQALSPMQPTSQRHMATRCCRSAPCVQLLHTCIPLHPLHTHAPPAPPCTPPRLQAHPVLLQYAVEDAFFVRAEHLPLFGDLPREPREICARGSPKPHIPRPTPHILRPKPLVSEWTGELLSADSPVRTRQRRLTRARATQTVWATRISTHSAASGPACRRSGWLGPSARGSGRSSCTACSAT